jgi:nucleoside-diphosphate-sugar epimerase
MIRNSRVVVTGGAGFIGLHLANFLAKESTNYVFIIDNFSRGKDDNSLAEIEALRNVSVLNMDIAGDLSDFPNADYIFHLASINGTQNFYTIPFDVTYASVVPTLNLLRHIKNSNVKRFILASTSEVYAGAVSLSISGIPTAETTPMVIEDGQNLRWSYAAGKIAAELATTSALAQNGTPVQIVRFHNVYGPRMGDQHVIPQFLKRALEGNFELPGSSNTRSFIYIDDAVTAITQLAKSENTIGKTINIGTSHEITMLSLAKTLMAVNNIKGNPVPLEAPTGSALRRCPDISLVRELIGFEPIVSLLDGLTMTSNYYRKAWGYESIHSLGN